MSDLGKLLSNPLMVEDSDCLRDDLFTAFSDAIEVLDEKTSTAIVDLFSGVFAPNDDTCQSEELRNYFLQRMDRQNHDVAQGTGTNIEESGPTKFAFFLSANVYQ